MPARPVFHPEIGQFFTGLREGKNWTQRQAEDIAERRRLTALTRQVLWRLEKGKVKNIDPKVLRALADLYQMSYEDLVARWTSHRYGVRIGVAQNDPVSQSADQALDLSGGKTTDAHPPATPSRLQQQHDRLLAATADITNQLLAMLDEQGYEFALRSDHVRTRTRKPRPRARARKAG